MRRELIIRNDAKEEIKNAYLWYEERQRGLGEVFLNDLEKCYEGVLSYPKSYQKKYKNIRHAVLKKFPFVVFFEILDSDIVVFSVFHSSREPMSWKR